MQYRRLGTSDLEVSEIGLGSWLTIAEGDALEKTRAVTDAAFDAGITFFDTANIYGQGAAEAAWGQILPSRPRDSYVLATKVWGPMSDEDSGLSATQISKQIDGSLTRLRTDYVDLYQAHRFDSGVPIEETLEAFAKVVEQGKARYLGFSEWTPEQIRTALEIVGDGFFVSSQPQYSMLWQAPEAEIFPLTATHRISQAVWSPLAQGILTGKYKPGEAAPEGSRFANEATSVTKDVNWSEAALEAVQRLVPIADGLGIALPQLALAWVLRRSEVASAIIGASRPEQVYDNAAASGVTLDAATRADIATALGDAPVTGPVLATAATTNITRRGWPGLAEGTL